MTVAFAVFFAAVVLWHVGSTLVLLRRRWRAEERKRLAANIARLEVETGIVVQVPPPKPADARAARPGVRIRR